MSMLIDTNIALYLFGGDARIAEILDGQVVYVSFITELELLGYPNITADEEKVIMDFLDNCVVMDPNSQIKEASVKFRRRYGLKLPDCIIAATAYYLGIPLISADKDFMRMKEIDFVAYERS